MELGTEPHKEKDPAGETMGSHRSNAESGTAEMSDGGSGPGARGLQVKLQLGCPSRGTQLGVQGWTADLGEWV